MVKIIYRPVKELTLEDILKDELVGTEYCIYLVEGDYGNYIEIRRRGIFGGGFLGTHIGDIESSNTIKILDGQEHAKKAILDVAKSIEKKHKIKIHLSLPPI